MRHNMLVNESNLTIAPSQKLNFIKVYNQNLRKIENFLRYKFGKNKYNSNEDYSEIAKDFFTYVWEKNLLEKFDFSRCVGNEDPIFKFLVGNLLNYLRIRRNQEKKLSHALPLKEVDNETYDENLGFCNDFKKISNKFVKSLVRLEKKAWRMFLVEKKSAEDVSKALGISRMTSFNLKKSINRKAKNIYNGYNNCKMNFA